MVGKSKIANLTILVPFIGYLILFNNELVTYLQLTKELLNIEAGKPNESISRLYFLYLGLTFIGFGSIAFSVFCPKIVKSSSTEYEFSDSEFSIMTHKRLFTLMQPFKSMQEHSRYLNREFDYYFSAYQNALKEFKEPESEKEAIEKRTAAIEGKAARTFLGLVWEYSLDYEISKRLFVSVLYAIGFTLVLIPSGQVFVKVVGLLFS